MRLPPLPQVDRPRLQQSLAGALTQPLTVVHAPLGFGKTSALLQALAHGRACWYIAAPWHGSAFIQPLIDAVREVRSDFGAATTALASNAAPPAQLGETFAQELRHSKHELVLVIDDAHELDKHAAFGDFMKVVLGRIPRSMHLAVLSRTLPPWLTPDIAAKYVTRIFNLDDLRFAEDEIVGALGSGATPAEIAAVHAIMQQTEGWPAALSLQWRHRDGAPSAVNAAALADLVFMQLPPRVQDHIALFAFSGGRTLSPEVAQELAAHGLVTHRGTLEPRVETLLQDAALRRLTAQPAVAQRLARRASQNAEAAADLRAALHFALRADDETLSSLLGRYPDRFAALGDDELLTAAQALIATASAHNAGLAYLQCLLMQQRGEPGVMEKVAAAQKLADAAGENEIAFLLRCKNLELRLGRLDDTVLADLVTLGARIGEASAVGRMRYAALSAWANILARRFQSALDATTAASDAAAGASFESGAAIHDEVLVPRAYAALALGDFPGWRRAIEAVLRKHEAVGELLPLVRALVWNARLALFEGDTVTALDAAKEAERLGEPLAMMPQFASLYNVLADAASQLGDIRTTLRAAQNMQRYAQDAWYANDAARAPHLALLYQARAVFLQGDIAHAHVLATRCARADAPASVRAIAAAEALAYATIARIATGDNVSEDPANASVFSQRTAEQLAPLDVHDAQDATLFEAAEAIELFFRIVTASDMSSSALQVVFNHYGAHAPTRYGGFQAFVMARRPVSGLPEMARRLHGANNVTPAAIAATAERLVHYAATGLRFEVFLVAAYVKTLCADTPAMAAAADQLSMRLRALTDFDLPVLAVQASATKRDYSLTERETEILHFLSQGFSNKELAEQFSLSPRTVETHVERVLAKLEVTSRSRAIAKAIRLRLVDVGQE